MTFTNDLSIRQRILDEIEARMNDMTDADYVRWSKVYTDSPAKSGKYDAIKAPCVAVFDRDESYDYQAGCVNCNLKVQIEYWLMLKLGQTATVELEKARIAIWLKLSYDLNLTERATNANLCVGIHMASSDKDVDGPRDRLVNGYLELEVMYRHAKSDPRKFV